MSIVLQSSGGGSVTLEEPVTASNLTITVPAATATMAIDGPAFSAYQSSAQTPTVNAWTKVQFQTEEFDTSNAFDSTTNYRFTPQVAGYYQVSLAISCSLATVASTSIYKNGSLFKGGNQTTGNTAQSFSTLLYLNGSTDYIEGYVYIANATAALNTGSSITYFQASMVRGA
jgi:hypothetical protein